MMRREKQILFCACREYRINKSYKQTWLYACWTSLVLVIILSLLSATFWACYTSPSRPFKAVLIIYFFKTYTDLTRKFDSISCYYMYKTRKYFIISKYPLVFTNPIHVLNEYDTYIASKIERNIRETTMVRWLGFYDLFTLWQGVFSVKKPEIVSRFKAFANHLGQGQLAIHSAPNLAKYLENVPSHNK